MVALAELSNLDLAHRLVRAGMRLSVITHMTGVGVRTLRSWWKEIHGTRPSNGKLPDSVLAFIESRGDAATLAAFACFYRAVYGAAVKGDHLLDACERFRWICGPIDINAAYYAVRDVRAGIVRLVRCPECDAKYLYDEHRRRHGDRCPFCGTRPKGELE